MRKYRMCPGQQPELVQEERVQEEGNDMPFGSTGPPAVQSPWPPGGILGREHHMDGAGPSLGIAGMPDPFHMMQRMEAMMGSLFGGPLPPGGLGQLPLRQEIPPQAPHQPLQPPPRVRIYEA